MDSRDALRLFLDRVDKALRDRAATLGREWRLFEDTHAKLVELAQAICWPTLVEAGVIPRIFDLVLRTIDSDESVSWWSGAYPTMIMT